MSTAFLTNLGLQDRVPNESEPSWLTHLRSEAVGRLLEEGMPHSKTEAWRFTSLRGLLDVPFEVAGRGAHQRECQKWAEELLGGDGTCRLFLVNGRPVGIEEGGFHDAGSGLEVHRLSQLLEERPESLQPYLARHARSEYFGALNSALFEDGLVVRLKSKSKPERPLHVVHIADPGEEPSSCYPRLVFVVEAHAELSLIETYLSRPGAKELTTAVTEVCLEDGARMEHLRVVEGNDTSSHIATLAVHQARNSSYTSRSVAMGGKLTRVEIEARLAGPAAECNLEGVYHVVGSEHAAHDTTIFHEESHCHSSEEYKGLLDDRGHGVFDGKIIVAKDTRGTSAHQQNHNLLLSDGATINTKPHLEIDADDLSASHGATVGALDPDQLFFLRARGIDEAQARAILTFSFVRALLDRISSKSVRDRLVQRLLSRLPHGAEIAELAE